MPTYKPALRGVRFTEAYAQAAAVALGTTPAAIFAEAEAAA